MGANLRTNYGNTPKCPYFAEVKFDSNTTMGNVQERSIPSSSDMLVKKVAEKLSGDKGTIKPCHCRGQAKWRTRHNGNLKTIFSFFPIY